ncbi:hypothetical protein KSD_12180 [Ktedonobacter sp. SOSP1-85]|uniref:hypothetical protein n=1 Tax=Ktedonobacter sp. SOSP1-85 TaxID=2778367 RepID=UPI001915675B|nr:hypothetical protein [Ktedonobacter sp. SOSP1-85]GHO73447.1 hypothetical protein KSD_12180 [Ktedonobacter sp. SOSP1-85]
MELLVATLTSLQAGKDIDSIARIRLVFDTARNAPGVISSNLYQGRGKQPYYLLLTTWDDETSWKSAGERHNPQFLLRSSMADLLAGPPQQWYMHYLWGYSRATRQPGFATVHLLSLPPQQLKRANQECLRYLHQLTLQAPLTFAFLAYGVSDGPSQFTQPTSTSNEPQTMLFGLFSWSSQEESEAFFQHPHTQALGNILQSLGKLHTLPFEIL